LERLEAEGATASDETLGGFVFLALANVDSGVRYDDLSPEDRARLGAFLARSKAARRERDERSPALAVCRREWARLGMPDPGEYDDLDLVEECLRLIGLPTPDPKTPPQDRTASGGAPGPAVRCNRPAGGTSRKPHRLS
jgi:hypothetical protein